MISKEYIRGLFATQLDSMEDQVLRQKVVDIWALGCQRGGAARYLIIEEEKLRKFIKVLFAPKG